MSKRVSFNRQTDKQTNRQTDKQTEQIVNSNRNYGIDLLRIISMIMIPTLHVLGHGGILENASRFSIQYEIAWFLEIACYCAVNTYALISGYVGYGRKIKYANLFYLYFQVLFYSAGISCLAKLLFPQMISLKSIVKSLFIISHGSYWYFSAYFCLFFFTPLLNFVIEKNDNKSIKRILLSLLFVFSIFPTLTHSDFGKAQSGYSFLWLAILYLFGAYIKKYDLKQNNKKIKNLVWFVVCVTITWISKFMIELLTIHVLGEPKGSGLLISYTSPTIVFCSIFLLLFFSKLKLGKYVIAFIKFFAPVSFGVYLFHLHPVIWNYVIKDAFISYLKFNPVLMLLAIIGTALFIWLFGSLVDRIRLILFDWLHVKQLCEWIEKKLRQAFCKIEKKVDAKYSIVE